MLESPVEPGHALVLPQEQWYYIHKTNLRSIYTEGPLMQKKIILLISNLVIAGSALFGADTTPWPTHYDAYQGNPVSDNEESHYYDTHRAELHVAIITHDEDKFDHCLEKIAHLPQDQQRYVLNEESSSNWKSPCSQAYCSSYKAAQTVSASEARYKELLPYYITLEGTNEERDFIEKEAAFGVSRRICLRIISHDQVDIIPRFQVWKALEFEHPNLDRLLKPLLAETANVIRRRFPIDQDLYLRIGLDLQIDTRLSRLQRLEDILSFHAKFTKMVGSEDEIKQSRAYSAPRDNIYALVIEKERKDRELQKKPETHQEKVDHILKQENLYAVLNVPQDASEASIRKACYSLFLITHPSAGKNQAIEHAEEAFQKVSEAKAVLTNLEKRREYNSELRLKRLLSFVSPS